MYLKENETFLDYKVVKLEYEDRYKEIYTVIEKAKHKKEKSLVFIKKCQKKNTCNLDAFDMKDCLIQCVPTCSYRASHSFTAVFESGKEKYEYFICEKLGKNLMASFFENGKRVSLETLRDYAYRMFNIIHVMQKKSKDGQCFASISPYDFYLTNYPRSNIVRIFMVNQNFKVKSYPSFTQKFDSIFVLKGEEPTLTDNAISICYCLLFLYYGTLPWMMTNSISDQIQMKKDFLNENASTDTPEEILHIRFVLLQLHEHRDFTQYDFSEIAKHFRTLSGCNVEHSFLDTTLSDSSFIMSPMKNKEENSIHKAVQSASQRQKDKTKQISSALLNNTISISKEDLPPASSVKRTHEEMEQNEEKIDEEEKGKKKQKIWNTIRTVVVDPLIITSAVLIGKYLFNHN